MSIYFEKYHGAGNDFIIINNLQYKYELDNLLVSAMCHRRFGVGGDGLIEILHSDTYPFKMKYYNSDGYEGSMCGNGGRCAVAYANKIGLVENNVVFEAVDGIHYAEVLGSGIIKLKMNDVSGVTLFEDGYLLNTGSPHFVQIVEDINTLDAFTEGKNLRYDSRFGDSGVNVNFISEENNAVQIITYERGVEDLTLSCGTGAVASAIIYGMKRPGISQHIKTVAKGGVLYVSYRKSGEIYSDIYLEGPAEFIMQGHYK